eukprot:SAG31_NODE_12097_length_967_cov_3.059839_1_plen_91_part_10
MVLGGDEFSPSKAGGRISRGQAREWKKKFHLGDDGALLHMSGKRVVVFEDAFDALMPFYTGSGNTISCGSQYAARPKAPGKVPAVEYRTYS